MLRVMLLTTDLELGGLPLRIARLAPMLPSVGVEPIVGCLARSGPVSERLESRAIQTFSCDAAGRFDVRCLRRLAMWLRRFDPDVLHAFLFHANLAGRLVGRLDRPRPLITSTVTIEIERSWHRWLESLTAGMSDLHMANSHAVAAHLEQDLGFSPRRLAVVPNGIDMDAVRQATPIRRSDYGIDESVGLVVWAGRMDPVKDLLTFIEVIDEVRRRRPVAAVLLGDGPQRPLIDAWIRQRGLEGVIQLALWSEDVLGWLKAADLLLLPSRTEGAPNVLLEALACGCPVVASNLPACRELLDNNGWLCPAGDVGAFARSVLEVLQDKGLARVRTAHATRRVSERHDLRTALADWLAMYRRVISA